MSNKEIELINDLWQLWEDIYMAGQLVTNKDFTPKYKELKAKVKILNKHIVNVPKGTVCRHCKAEDVKLIDGLCYGCNCLKV